MIWGGTRSTPARHPPRAQVRERPEHPEEVRGGPVADTPRFREALRLRDEVAGLLGYGSHAELMCETKMVGTPREAEEFLLELVNGYEPMRERELGLSWT